MNTGPWDAHTESLLDLLMEARSQLQTTSSTTTTTTATSTSTPLSLLSDLASNKSKKSKKRKKEDHPMWIGGPTARTCINKKCATADPLDLIVDANGGSVVCIQCGTIQTTSVLESAPTFADFQDGRSSATVVHRYSRIAYLRGLLTSIDGETNVELTSEETKAILHHVRVHGKSGDGTTDFVRAIKRAVGRMRLRRCLCYHAYTIAFRLFGVTHPPPSETDIRKVLTRFRALENEWDRAPRNGQLRNGVKKFPSLPWMWQRICRDMRDELEEDSTLEHLFHVPPTKQKCEDLRTKQYNKLVKLAR